MGVHGGPDIVTDGIYIMLDAGDENSYPGSGTTWTDLTGANGQNGTLSEAAIGTVSSSLSEMAFEGTNEIVTITHDTSFAYSATADWTLSLWAIVTGTNSGFLISKRTSGTSFWNVQHSAGDNLLTWGNQQSGGSDGCNTANGTIPENVYFNWTGVHQGTADKMFAYVNGALNNSITKSNTTSGNYGTSNIFLGKIINQEYLIGRIGSFIGYTKALSAKEVLQNYNAKRSRFGV